MKHLPSLKALRTKADKAWALKVKLRTAICEVCEERAVQAAHHAMPKGRYGFLRYDPRVGVAICHRCHINAQRDPGPGILVVVKRHGLHIFADWILQARQRKGIGKRWTRKELEKVIVEATG